MAVRCLEDRSEEVTLAQAEAEYQLCLELIGVARSEFRARLDAGEIPDTADLDAIGKALGNAWRQMQSERNHVAEHNRKHGIAVAGDLDLAAARAEVCERLARLAAAIAAG